MKHQLVVRENGTHQVLKKVWFDDKNRGESKARKKLFCNYDFSKVYMRVEK